MCAMVGAAESRKVSGGPWPDAANLATLPAIPGASSGTANTRLEGRSGGGR